MNQETMNMLKKESGHTLLLTAMVGVLSLTGCGNKTATTESVAQFPVVTVETSSIELSESYPASIRGKQDIEVRPQVSGFITKLCVDEGASVQKGQALFLIDDVTYKAALDQAVANREAAEVAVATAELTYNNKKELHAENIIGDYDLQTAENSLLQARASLAQAQAAETSAKQNLSYCTVTSPGSGVVGTFPYRVGALVSSSISEPLTTVSTNTTMQVYFSMPESEILSRTRTSGGDIVASFPSVNLTLSDGTTYDEPGQISMVSGVVDASTGSVSMRADFPNPSGLLKTGSSGSIVVPRTVEGVIVAQSSTEEVQDRLFMYILDKDNKVQYMEVEVDPQNDGNNYIVTKGLNVGDRYVCNGLTKLSDGMQIDPITPEQYEKNIAESQKMGATQGQ